MSKSQSARPPSRRGSTDRNVTRRDLMARAGATAAACSLGGIGGSHAGAVATVKALPVRLRGISFEMRGEPSLPAMAQQYAAWGVNLIRVNVTSDAFAAEQPDELGARPQAGEPLAPYRNNLRRLHALADECHRLGIAVIIAADQIYGRRLDYFITRGGDAFRDGLEGHLMEFWAGVVGAFRDHPAVVGYDLLNEPNYSGRHPAIDSPDIWHEIVTKLIKLIRGKDQSTWIILMPWPWGLARGFDQMRFSPDPHLLYSFHFYSPHSYTHQGVGSASVPRGAYVYPGIMPEFPSDLPIKWDRAALRKAIAPAIAFRDRYGVRIIVGEFGVVRWAPGKEAYLADLVSILEDEEFDWAFHSYASWNGWNPTLPPEAPSEAPPAVQLDGGFHGENHKLLLAQWAKNRW